MTTTAPVTPTSVSEAMPRKDKAHVRHARVADQEVQIALAHGHQSAEQDVAQAQQRQHPHPALRRLRHQRQRDPEQTIQPELLQHAGMEHRGGRGCRRVSDRRPGVKGPERNQNPKAEQQQREDGVLGLPALSGLAWTWAVRVRMSNEFAPACR
jgi:hypothetical protein